MTHRSVLLHEAINGLDIKKGDIFVDGTLGGGGHLEEAAKRFPKEKGNGVVMIAIDLDQHAISRASARLEPLGVSVSYLNGNFRDMDKLLDSIGIGNVDKILLDIGLSSNQFEDSGRGFSFQRDEPLMMTFKENIGEGDLTAQEIVNTWDEENIRTILDGYGEEKFAYKIAKAIVETRKTKPINTTFDLVEIIKSATPKFYHHKKIHPATKTFQALRITVNDEINNLKDGLKKGFERLNPSGRIAVISFHSIEDRIVKDFFREKEDAGLGKRMTKKPILPTDEEILENPRGRSAKLRIVQKI